MSIDCPRLVLSGLAGGSGKTLLTLGLVRALVRRSLAVQACKKGPDYIDVAWLAAAAKRLAFNLDPYFLSETKLLTLVEYYLQTQHSDALIIEGNRGLYDGKDVQGTCSTAHVARLLKAPVIVVLPCTKMTRTMAAVVHGLSTFEDCGLAGVILNHVGSERHGRLVQASIEQYTDVPVLGIVPRLANNLIPEQHMGLMALHELDTDDVFERLADLVEEHLDVPRVLALAQAAVPLETGVSSSKEGVSLSEQTLSVNKCATALWPTTVHAANLGKAPVIGVVRDTLLWFYYEENLEALRRAGAKLVELDLLDVNPWPQLDGLYLGGGFPESRAAELADSPHLSTIRSLSDANLPIYAECGGFLLLCHAIAVEGHDYPMAGVFPLRVELHAKPQGLGYVDVTVRHDNIFYREGATFRAHEFHYTKCAPLEDIDLGDFVFALKPGVGMGYEGSIPRGLDGLVRYKTFGAYTHVYAPTVPEWATSFVAACQCGEDK